MPKNRVKIELSKRVSKDGTTQVHSRMIHINGPRLGGRKSVLRVNAMSTLELQTAEVRGRDKNKVAKVLKDRLG